ncbi:CARDB domain-containing protein [Methanosarcina barkeri]|nr:CARDB domain-containing protein [Methanosarcina barkeri]
MKIKTDFFSSVISVLLIMLIISGMTASIASAADKNGTDPVDSTNDLIIEGISCSPENPEPGEAVTIKIAVTNKGTAVSEQTEAVCKIGDEDPIDVPIIEIKPEETLLVSFPWTPEEEGTVKIKATLGDSKKTIEVVVEKEKSPNLTIESLSIDPESPKIDSEVTVNALIKNTGNEVSEATKLTYEIGEAEPKTVKVPEIDPEDSSLISFTWTPKEEGTVKIKVVVEDNEKTIEVVVEKEKSPNLTIESLSIDPESPKTDSEVTVNALIKNTGNEVSEATKLTYEIGEAEPKTVKVPEIDPEDSSLVSFTWTPKEEGTVKIKAAVEDNEKTIEVVVEKEKSPNLTIESLSIDPESPKTDSEVTIKALVKNVGTKTSEPTNIIYTIGETKEKEEVSAIEAGSEKSISHKWTTSDKEETVTIKASLENVENSEKEISVKIAKKSLPDLIVEDIYSDPSIQPEAGKLLNFTLKIKNVGEATANSNTAKYSFNGASEGEISIPELSAGTSTSAGFSFTPGNEETMSVTVIADSGNRISESNEDNNKMSKTISVKRKLPDLKIESISLSPEKPHPGENITFTATVKNNGSAAAENSEIKYDIKGNNESYTGVTPLPALAAGETGTGTFFWTPGNEGQIEVKTTVDTGSVVSESNETNNEFTKTATIYKETVSSDDGGSGSSGSSGSDSGSKSSGSSSSSSGGASLSKEPVSNVDAKELSTRNVQSGYHIKFDFLEGATCITYIEFDSIKTLKRTITTAEVLKDKSVFVSEVPPGNIYKYVNIWVGNYGTGVANYCENGVIEFKVEKPWFEENNINQSQITLQWYNESWEPLNTEKVKEDTNYVYFKSKTPGFSCFAITSNSIDGENVSVASGLAEGKVLRNWNGETNTSTFNGSAETDGKIKNPMGKAKILMAISLPLFLIFVEYFVMKKKI